MSYQAFQGPNGWYVAFVGRDGFHRQPSHPRWLEEREAKDEARRVNALEPDRVLIATDEGTHAKPLTQRVYREADGSLTLASRHGESNARERTLAAGTKVSDLPTDGRWRMMVRS